jgi:hypothetical protein
MKPGDLVGDRFVVAELAGTGGMGRVYKATDRRTGAPIALKIIASGDAAADARFDHEARVLAALEHPRVVRYVAHGRAGAEELWLAMEWIEGETLGDRLTRAALRVEESLAVARGVAEALAAAHARGVVHRDIKPSNIVLADGDPARVKVLDFGIAHVLGATRALTRTGTVMGTPGYLAPEQARGDRGSIDARADVFSLGAVLFECLAGRPAFEGTHVMALLAKLLLEEPPRLADVRPGVPPALDALVARMLAKEPSARPSDGAAVLAALARVGEAEGAGPGEPPAAQRAITTSEQRLLSVVVATPAPEARSAAPAPEARSAALDARPADATAPDLWSTRITAIHAATAPLGARVERLADGTLLLVLAGSGSAMDQAAQAARAALSLRAIVPGARISLVTGRGEATGRLPVGEILERAARMLRPPDDTKGERGDDADPAVRIDETTHALLDARFDVALAESARLLLGEREIGEAARTLLGRPTPCVGRDRELRHLRDHLEECFDDGQGARVLLVTGAGGMGKSRLRFELVREIGRARPSAMIAIGRGDSMSAGSPFSLLGSALRSVAGIMSGEPSEAQRAKLLALVSRAPPEARAHTAAFLGEILGAPFPDGCDPRLRAARQSPSLMVDHIQRAFLELMTAACAAGPVLLVLEDLHWGDAASVKLVDHALRELSERPLAVLALARPEVHVVFPGLWAGRELHEIRLGALPRRAAEILARHALGEALPDAALGPLVERAAGNAFYLEELVRAVAEGRGEVLPETVLGMVEARLAALDVEARRLLRAASVFGETFWEGAARALMGATIDTEASDATLRWLVEHELVVRRSSSRFAGEAEYAFRHALMRDGSYAMLTERDRALGHRLAAEWLLGAGEHDPKVIGEHFERSDEPRRAVSHYLRAAEQALLGNDNALLAALTEKGIRLGAEGDTAAAFHALDAESAIYSFEVERGLAAGEAALRLAPPGSPSECRALGSLVLVALFSQRFDRFDAYLPRLLAIDPAPEAVPMFSRGCTVGLTAVTVAGLRGASEACLRRLEQVTQATSASDPHTTAFLCCSRAYWARFAEGDPYAALSLDLEARALFEAAGDARFFKYEHIQIGYDYLFLGDAPRAEEALRVAVDGLATDGALGPVAVIYLARARFLRGDLDEAYALVAPIIAQQGFYRAYASGIAASVHLARGEVDAAERALLMDVGPVLSMSIQAFWVLAVLVEIRLRQGRFAEALGLADNGLARQAAVGMFWAYPRPELLCARAAALSALGQKEAARATWREARAEILERAGKIADPDLRRSFLENVQTNARILAEARAADG